jgi:translation initiation factor IF-2
MINLAEIRKKTSMEPDKNIEGEKKKVTVDGIADKLIEKAEEFIDETADKIYKSEPYRKAGNSIEKATLSIFRKAGKFWGKL